MNTIVVMSYPHLTSLIQSLHYTPPESVAFSIINANVKEVVAKAKRLENIGEVEVFVSAGANAKLLSENIQKPIVEIKITGFDVLQALKKAKNYADRVGHLVYFDQFKEGQRICIGRG